MINTILLDFGGVLAYPISGNWFIPFDLMKITGLATTFKMFFKKNKMNKAFIAGNEYLQKNHKLSTEDEEYEQFCQFYRIVFKEMKINVKDQVINKLARSRVFDDFQIHVYDDSASGIRELKEKYKVMIISDTWPSTKRILKNSGILELLDGLILSCDYNETKETTELFKTAIKELKLVPEECIFIDDSVKNLKSSEKVGFKPVLMDRRSTSENTEYPVIKSMEEIKGII